MHLPHLPWRKILNLGVLAAEAAGGPAAVIAGAISSSVHVVDENLPALKGPNAAAASDALVIGVLNAVEGGANKDLLDDAEVLAASHDLRDAVVALRNAEAALVAAVEKAKAARSAGAGAASAAQTPGLSPVAGTPAMSDPQNVMTSVPTGVGG